MGLAAKLSRQIDNIINAIADGVAGPSMKAKLAGLEREKAEAESELAAIAESEAAAESVIALHPKAVDEYRHLV